MRFSLHGEFGIAGLSNRPNAAKYDGSYIGFLTRTSSGNSEKVACCMSVQEGVVSITYSNPPFELTGMVSEDGAITASGPTLDLSGQLVGATFTGEVDHQTAPWSDTAA